MRSDTSLYIQTRSSSWHGSTPPIQGEGLNYRPLRCWGEAIFATAMAVDVARLLDVDPAIDHWSCGVPLEGGALFADFCTCGSRGEEHLILQPGSPPPTGPQRRPAVARIVTPEDIDPVRLENAKLILPFARWRVSLDDRIRLLTVLDEEGSVTLADCLKILRDTSRPVAAVAALVLAHVVDMDLDEPIGSRTRVIRREA